MSKSSPETAQNFSRNCPMVVPFFSKNGPKVLREGPKIVQKLPTKLSKNYPKVVQKLPKSYSKNDKKFSKQLTKSFTKIAKKFSKKRTKVLLKLPQFLQKLPKSCPNIAQKHYPKVVQKLPENSSVVPLTKPVNYYCSRFVRTHKYLGFFFGKKLLFFIS